MEIRIEFLSHIDKAYRRFINLESGLIRGEGDTVVIEDQNIPARVSVSE